MAETAKPLTPILPLIQGTRNKTEGWYSLPPQEEPHASQLWSNASKDQFSHPF